MNFLAFVSIQLRDILGTVFFKVRFHLDAFGDHERSSSGCGHAKRRCLKTDTTRFQTAPWPLSTLAASKVLVNVVHTLRDQKARVNGGESDGSGNARRTGLRPR